MSDSEESPHDETPPPVPEKSEDILEPVEEPLQELEAPQPLAEVDLPASPNEQHSTDETRLLPSRPTHVATSVTTPDPSGPQNITSGMLEDTELSPTGKNLKYNQRCICTMI